MDDVTADLAHTGVELRHLRYLVAVADAGTFTHAAERLFITQPTISHQIRQLEEIVGVRLLERRREGVGPTAAGQVLLEDARALLSLLEHGVSRSRQVAGLGRPRLRFALPPNLPDELAVPTASRLRATAAAAGAEVVWLETPLDAEFSLIRQRRADAGLGWLTAAPETMPEPLEVMTLGEFQPEVWAPADRLGARQVIGLDELADMNVIHGPRRTSPGTYDAWRTVLRGSRPQFEFTDPPFRHSLLMTLALAATTHQPTAVLTGPARQAGDQGEWCGVRGEGRNQGLGEQQMIAVGLNRPVLTATAVMAWSGDLPRQLQQVLFDTADAGYTDKLSARGRAS